MALQNEYTSLYGTLDVNNFSFAQEVFEEIPCEPVSSTNIVKQAYDIVKHDLVFTGSLDV